MSRINEKSEKNIVLCAALLIGVIFGSLFIRFSSAQTVSDTCERMLRTLSLSSFHVLISRWSRELLFLLLCVVLCRTPGKIGAFLILFYKGVSFGVISSVLCRSFGAGGIVRMFCFVLPQTSIYVAALLLAIIYAPSHAPRGAHDKSVKHARSAFYLLLVALLLIGALVETFAQPWIFKTFF